MKDVFEEVFKKARMGETIRLIAKKSIHKKGKRLSSRGCVYYLRLVDDVYSIGRIVGGVFSSNIRIEKNKYAIPGRAKSFHAFLAERFIVHDGESMLFIQVNYKRGNLFVYEWNISKLIRTDKIKEVQSYWKDADNFERFFCVDMMHLEKFTREFPDLYDDEMEDGAVLKATDIFMDLEVDIASCTFFHQ